MARTTLQPDFNKYIYRFITNELIHNVLTICGLCVDVRVYLCTLIFCWCNFTMRSPFKRISNQCLIAQFLAILRAQWPNIPKPIQFSSISIWAKHSNDLFQKCSRNNNAYCVPFMFFFAAIAKLDQKMHMTNITGVFIHYSTDFC